MPEHASCSPPFHKLLRQPIWSRGCARWWALDSVLCLSRRGQLTAVSFPCMANDAWKMGWGGSPIFSLLLPLTETRTASFLICDYLHLGKKSTTSIFYPYFEEGLLVLQTWKAYLYSISDDLLYILILFLHNTHTHTHTLNVHSNEYIDGKQEVRLEL